jgi:hypothetical protein
LGAPDAGAGDAGEAGEAGRSEVRAAGFGRGMGRVVETVTAGSTVASAGDSGAGGDGEREGAADGTAATASGSHGACATAARKPALNKTINAKWRNNVDTLRPRMPAPIPIAAAQWKTIATTGFHRPSTLERDLVCLSSMTAL